ncbi:PRC-barrel domain-containing protein [Pseudochelatococcus sp. B33]
MAESSALSSNLIGLNVTNAGGQSIGEIKDVVLSANNGIAGFVVSVGGFLGMGEHYVVVDPSAIVVNYDGNDKKWLARMNATADQLKAAPAFTYAGKWKS